MEVLEQELKSNEMYGKKHTNGFTTEESIVEMMLKSVHTIKGKLIKLEEKLKKACSS